jgi:hypothetical protein
LRLDLSSQAGPKTSNERDEKSQGMFLKTGFRDIIVDLLGDGQDVDNDDNNVQV